MDVLPTDKLSDVLAFIREWKETSDVKEACEKFNIPESTGYAIVNGRIKKPRVDFIKYLKDKAFRNYQKLKV